MGYNSSHDLIAQIVREYEMTIEIGEDHDVALARAAERLSNAKKDLSKKEVSQDLTELILRHVNAIPGSEDETSRTSHLRLV